jgi:hypothetical protein
MIKFEPDLVREADRRDSNGKGLNLRDRLEGGPNLKRPML